MQYLFFAIALLIIGAINIFVGSRLINHSGVPQKYQKALWGVWLLFNFVVLFQLMTRFRFGPEALHWFALIGFAFLSVLFFLVIVSELVQVFIKWAKKLSKSSPTDEGKRTLIRSVVNSSILLGATGSTAMGVRTARARPEVISVDIPIENLHPDLEGLNIVQFSDLHVGPTIRKDYVDRVVGIINELDADIIAFTGDLADGLPDQLQKDVEPLRALKAKLGKFYVNGNHEYYWDAPAWLKKSEELGFTALPNAHKIISRGKGKIMIAGVYDRRADRVLPEHKSDPKEAIANAEVSDLSVLLAHRPNSVYDAVDLGFDLQLSGHTHGGQFWPWNMFVGLAHEFHEGLGRYKDKMWVYVNRGTGYWGPPVRTSVPTEITKLTFRKK